jgi:general secretion pathway protein L
MRPENSPSILINWQLAKNAEQDLSSWLIIETRKQGYGLASLKSELSDESALRNKDALSQRETILLIPAESTLTARVFVPSRKPAHIRAAIPHLIEEWTLTNSESLHLSNGERFEDGHVAVTAIDRNYFSQVVHAVDSSQFNCRTIYTDASLLPYTPNTLTLLIDSARVLLRWNAEQTGALEINALIPFLTALCKRQSFEIIEILSTAGTSGDNIDDIEHCLASLMKNVIPIRRHTVPSLLYFCADQIKIASLHPINLRQREFTPQRTQFKQWQRWQPLAIAAAICLVLQIGLNVIAGWRFDRQADKTHEQAVQIYRELFPDDKRIVNLRQQFQNHLSNSAQTDQLPFFALFGHLTQEIKNTQPSDPIRLHSLVYDTKAGNLQIELVMPSVPMLDDLQKRLSTNDFLAKVTSAQNVEGLVIGRLSLTGKSQ